MTLEELDQIEAGLKHWQRPGDWGLKLVEDFRTTLLQVREAETRYGCLKIQEQAALNERDNALRLYDECLKIAERFQSYSPHTPSDLDLGWKGAAGRIAEEIRNLKQTENRKCAHCGSESRNVTCSVCIGTGS